MREPSLLAASHSHNSAAPPGRPLSLAAMAWAASALASPGQRCNAAEAVVSASGSVSVAEVSRFSRRAVPA